MRRKGEARKRRGGSSTPEGEPQCSVASTATTTNEDRDAAIEAAINESPPEISVQFRTLRRRMWVGAVCVVIAIVALVKLLP